MDGWDLWMQTIASLAPVPVEVVLLEPPSKSSSNSRNTEITLVDKRSFMTAMKVVERAQREGDFLRFRLHPIKGSSNKDDVDQGDLKAQTLSADEKKQSSKPKQDAAVSASAEIKECSTNTIPKNVDHKSTAVEKAEIKERGTNTAPRKVVHRSTGSEELVVDEKLRGFHHSQTTMPTSSNVKGDKQVSAASLEDLKTQLESHIDAHFQRLSSDIDRKLDDMAKSISASLTESVAQMSLISGDSRSVRNLTTQSSRVEPAQSVLESEFGRGRLPTSQMSNSFLRSSVDVPLWVNSLPAPIYPSAPVLVAEVPQQQSSYSVDVADDAHCSGGSDVSDPERMTRSSGTSSPFMVLAHENTASESGSIVVVERGENIGDLETRTVTDHSDSVEVVERHQEDHDDSGSVAFIATDDEDEEDGLDSLRSWAAEKDASGAQSRMGESFVTAVPGSLQGSFYSASVGSSDPEIVDAPVEVEFQEPVLEAESVENSFNEIAELQNDTEAEVPVEQNEAPEELRDSSERPMPINGSDQLPVDLNAMLPVDQQSLFSPHTDIQTKFLSAASAIANGFTQSVQLLAKTLRELEERSAQYQMPPEHRAAGPHSSSSEQEIVMENVANVGSSEDPEQINEQPVEDHQQPAYERRRHPPPASTGPYMSLEEIEWYLEQLGASELGSQPWAQSDHLTRDEFNFHVNSFFESALRD